MPEVTSELDSQTSGFDQTAPPVSEISYDDAVDLLTELSVADSLLSVSELVTRTSLSEPDVRSLLVELLERDFIVSNIIGGYQVCPGTTIESVAKRVSAPESEAE